MLLGILVFLNSSHCVLADSAKAGVCTEACVHYVMLLFLSRLLSFPTNLINASDTRRGIAKAFGMWSDVSPFSFREVPADQEADIKIGGCSASGCISPQQMFSGLLLCRYCFSLRAVIAGMFLPPNVLNQTTTTVPCLYSAWFIISKKINKTSMPVSPRWSTLNYALPVPFGSTPGSCINSQWQWEEWLSSCMVKTEANLS